MYDQYGGVLWTALPMEVVLEGMASTAEVPACVDLSVAGRLVQVVPGADGMGTIQRLISGDVQDYLDPRFQPGVRVPLS